MHSKLRVGVVLNDGYCKDKTIPKNIFKDALEEINRLDIESIVFEDILIDRKTSKKAGEFFNRNNVDVLLVIEANYSESNFLVDVTKFIDCPIIFLAPPDPIGKPTPLSGSLCGVIENAGVLVKMEKNVDIILGDIKSDKNLEKLKYLINLHSIIKKLKKSTIGVIGGRCPGMLDVSFHELELTRKFGPEIVYISTADLIRDINSINEKDVQDVREKLNITDTKNKVSKDILIESLKIYLAASNVIKDYDLDAIAMRCWPELRNNNICTPCFTLSRLTDDNIISTCEGDATSALTMYLLFLLTENKPFLVDMLTIDNSNNEAQYFHCGAMASCLAEKEEFIEYREHSLYGEFKPGLTVEFPLKPGKVTFARIGEIKGKYRILSYSGEAVKSKMFVRGNVARIILDKEPEYIVNELIKNGSEHHQIAVHGDISKELENLSRLLKVEYIQL